MGRVAKGLLAVALAAHYSCGGGDRDLAKAESAFRSEEFAVAEQIARPRAADPRFRLLLAAALQGRGKPEWDLLREPVPAALEARRLWLRALAEDKPALLDEAREAAVRHAPDELVWIDMQWSARLRGVGRFGDAAGHSDAAVALSERMADAGLRVRALVERYLVSVFSLAYGEALSPITLAARLAQSNAQKVRTLQNLGDLHARLGEFDESMGHLKAASALALGPHMGARRATIAFIRGNNHYMAKDWTGAAAAYRQSLGESPPNATSVQLNLAAALIQSGGFDQAREVLAPVDKSRRNQVALYLGEIELGGRNHGAAGERFDEVSRNTPSPSEKWEALYGQARARAQAGDTRGADTFYERARQAIDEYLAQVREDDVGIVLFAQIMDFHRNYVAALFERGEADRALAAADSSRARILRARLGASRVQGGVAGGGAVDDFQESARRARACTLTYWLGDQSSYAWLVSPAGVVPRRLPPRAEIDRRARAYRAAVEDAVDTLQSRDASGMWLYDQLVAPFRRGLAGCPRVYVVPDGELHRVAFDSLLAGEGADRHFLVEDMVLATAIRAGGLERSRDPDPKMALLVGDATPLPPALPESVKFPRLASAAVEMDRIPASLPGTTASQLRGAAAVPAAYSASQPGRYSLLHFSAHAVPNELRPLQSAIILSDSPRGYRLQASEVAAVRIDSTELVTLSACHSAGARSYSGEGLVGFAWAFLGAGARHVVAGLWDVTDNLMPDFMADFYTQVGRRTPIPESLRQAKLSLMRRARKPYYWAPMQAFVR